jgi:phage baseplate assembly protein W
MAFGAKKIFPIDTKPSTAVGVSIPFNAVSVFNPTYTTKDAIRNNLINFFLTEPGERYFNSFGGGIRSLIFEQINTNSLEFLKEDIQSKIILYFPSVIITSLEVTSSEPDTNQVFVSLYYNIKDTGITDQIEIAFI